MDADAKGLAFCGSTRVAVATAAYYLNDRVPHRVLQTSPEIVHFLSERPGTNSLMITREAFARLTKDLPPDFEIEEVTAESAMPFDYPAVKAKKLLIVRFRAPNTAVAR